MKSSPLPLPSGVRAAAETALGAARIKEELAWMSWAGTVWRLSGETGSVFIKRAADLTGERDRLAWLAGRWPVPEVVGFLHEMGDDWLVTHEVPGVPMSQPSIGWEASRVATKLESASDPIRKATSTCFDSRSTISLVRSRTIAMSG